MSNGDQCTIDGHRSLDTSLDGVMRDLPYNQKVNEGRHRCAFCAYEAGRRAEQERIAARAPQRIREMLNDAAPIWAADGVSPLRQRPANWIDTTVELVTRAVLLYAPDDSKTGDLALGLIARLEAEFKAH